jgi:hypothetical protein
LTFSNASKEVRIIDAPCNSDGSDIASNVTSYGGSSPEGWADIVFHHNGTTTYSIYYDNSLASYPNYSNLPLLLRLDLSTNAEASNFKCNKAGATTLCNVNPTVDTDNKWLIFDANYPAQMDWIHYRNISNAVNPNSIIRDFQTDIDVQDFNGNWKGIVFRTNSTFGGYTMMMYSSSSPYSFVYDTSGESSSSFGSSGLSLNTWYKLEMRVDTENTENSETTINYLLNDASQYNRTWPQLQGQTGSFGFVVDPASAPYHGGTVIYKNINATTGRFYEPPSSLSLGSEETYSSGEAPPPPTFVSLCHKLDEDISFCQISLNTSYLIIYNGGEVGTIVDI